MVNSRVARHRILLISVCYAFGAAARAETIADARVSAAPGVGSLLFVPSDIYNAAGGGRADKAAADAAFKLARAAVEAGDVSSALQLACHAVAVDPDHADARRLLGYQRVGEHWAGKYAQRLLETGHVWRREFGWVK